jgi:hypothetical protein
MRTDGAVVLINVVELEGQCPFVVNIVGKVMRGDCITIEASTIEESLAVAIIEYAKRFWGWPAQVNLALYRPCSMPSTDSNHDRAIIVAIGESFGITIPQNWSGCDAVWPLIERMQFDGAVVLIKLDGERTSDEDNGPYTVVVSGKSLEDSIRIDTFSIDAGLAFVITEYARQVWGLKA